MNGTAAQLAARAPLRTIRVADLAAIYAHPRQEARALDRRGVLHRLAHGFYCAVPPEFDPAVWRPSTEAADAFVAATLAAWLDRHAPRDLYDLATLADRGLIGASAVALFARLGPTSRPLRPEVFDVVTDEDEWAEALAHQTRLTRSAREALAVLRREGPSISVTVPQRWSSPAVGQGRPGAPRRPARVPVRSWSWVSRGSFPTCP